MLRHQPMPLKQNIQTETMFEVVFCVLFFYFHIWKKRPVFGGAVYILWDDEDGDDGER